MDNVINVVFVKWGNKYNDDQLVSLFDQVYSYLGDWREETNVIKLALPQVSNQYLPFNFKYRFYCDGFDWNKYNLNARYPTADIQHIQIPPGLHLKGVWNKLSMFSEDFPLEGKVFYLDLDTYIKGDFFNLLYSIDWSKLTMVDCHWKSKSIITATNYDVVINSSILAWDHSNPHIHQIWNHFNSGLRDYFLRKYVKGIDRFIYHEQSAFKPHLIDNFRRSYIQSYKYEPINKPAAIVTFEEVDFGSIDTVSLFKSN